MIFDKSQSRFEFHPGGDVRQPRSRRRNQPRTPKTQSALLEAMQEQRVTVGNPPGSSAVHGDGDAEPDRDGRHVPAARSATRSLPHADLRSDTPMPRPSARSSAGTTTVRPSTRCGPSSPRLGSASSLPPPARSQRPWRYRTTSSPGRATRSMPDVRLGVSPRGSVALLRAARALAWRRAAPYVVPEDVKALARSVFAHRIIVDPEAELLWAPGDRAGRSGTRSRASSACRHSLTPCSPGGAEERSAHPPLSTWRAYCSGTRNRSCLVLPASLHCSWASGGFFAVRSWASLAKIEPRRSPGARPP